MTSKVESDANGGQLFYSLPAATTRAAGQFDPGSDALLVEVLD